jgi:hypothetical protein
VSPTTAVTLSTADGSVERVRTVVDDAVCRTDVLTVAVLHRLPTERTGTTRRRLAVDHTNRRASSQLGVAVDDTNSVSVVDNANLVSVVDNTNSVSVVDNTKLVSVVDNANLVSVIDNTKLVSAIDPGKVDPC